MVDGALPGNVRLDLQGPHHYSDVKPASFRVEVVPGEPIVVAPFGELDMATVHDLDDTLRDLFDRDCRQLTLDLRGLSFMDSQGIHLVVKWNSLAQESGITFSVIQGGAAIRYLFELVGLLDHLPFVGPDDESAALRVRA